MRMIDCGISGAPAALTPPARWEDLPIDPLWRATLAALRPGASPRPVQALALSQFRILDTRRNLVVSAPTNAGKTLVGLLTLLQAIHRGQRAIFLVPLRAIARERAEELTALLPELHASLHRTFTVRVTTGDYRLDDELFSAPPPENGELIVATPERLEAILRQPGCDEWLASVGAVCVDEAHLISSKERGPTLEYLLTSLLCLPAPPRLTLLSATLGATDRVAAWLSPCDVVSVPLRWPPLHKEVVALDPGEETDAVVGDLARHILREPDTSLLIFVYQTRSAERLAARLAEVLDSTSQGLAGDDAPAAYHSQLSTLRRDTVRAAFTAGRCRCVVATSALSLGVNLPATHVIIRDTTFAGVGPVSVADLLQMAGRAGRGDQAGHALVLVRPTDDRSADDLARSLRNESVASLHSPFDRMAPAAMPNTYGSATSASSVVALAATQVAAQLSHRPERGLSQEELTTFFSHSLAGDTLATQVRDALQWLMDPAHALAYRNVRDETVTYHPTVLGLNATRAILPLRVAASFGQLVRDLLSLDPSDHLLERWRPLDHLLLLELVTEQPIRRLRPFSAALADQVDAWMEAFPDQVSLLFREWIAGQSGASRAQEVFGSLGLRANATKGNQEEGARKEAYLATFRAILLYQRAEGIAVDDLERRWRIKGLEGIEERWRDERLWLLSGLAQILDLRCFYFHLRESCDADPTRVRRVKRHLQRIRAQAFELQQQVKYCSPLGALVQSIRRTRVNTTGGATIGIESVRRLEAAGIRSLSDLMRLSASDLARMGMRHDFATQIETYVRRRLQ